MRKEAEPENRPPSAATGASAVGIEDRDRDIDALRIGCAFFDDDGGGRGACSRMRSLGVGFGPANSSSGGALVTTDGIGSRTGGSSGISVASVTSSAAVSSSTSSSSTTRSSSSTIRSSSSTMSATLAMGGGARCSPLGVWAAAEGVAELAGERGADHSMRRQRQKCRGGGGGGAGREELARGGGGGSGDPREGSGWGGEHEQ